MTGQRSRPTVLSLFTGAGGLDLGLEAAGFQTKLCVEIDVDARATLQRNRPDWTLATPGDIHKHKPRDLLALAGLKEEEVDLLVGGPPCQPFSKSGYWSAGDSKRLRDPRASTLRAFLDVVDAALPRAALLENVRGLTFSGKSEGFRLLEQGFDRINRRRGTAYRPVAMHLNAAHYGVPQFRERVFLVAARSGDSISMPRPTHGPSGALKYRTAWDAIGDLDVECWPLDLELTGKWAKLIPSVPEGENYLWHTPKAGGQPLFGWRTRYWSFLLKLAKNKPSWTIQAEPGPATGPFHWKNRHLSVPELSRLQTFPDAYVIVGDRRSAQRQLGNAVPCALAEAIGVHIREQWFGDSGFGCQKPGPKRNKRCPPPERTLRVPSQYFELRAKHRPHPGIGLGPGARRRRRSAQATAKSQDSA
jgi:DNA (cytosine-5)-methyltransferase 1